MSNYYFLKLHYDILDDWKVGTLPDSLKWRFIQCLCVAGEVQEGGLLPDINQFAYRIRQEPSALHADMARLSNNGLVELVALENSSERWFITNYEKRQARSTSTERTRRQRERDRKAGVKREYWQKSIYADLPESPGVYSIECTGSKKVYIGGSKNIKSRVRAHLSNMNTGGHAISDDLEKYGKASITATALELTDDTAALPDLENKWISAYDLTELYNNPKTPGKRHRAWDRTEKGQGRDTGGTNRPTDKNRIDKSKSKNKSKKPTPQPITIPDCLNTPTFIAAWSDFTAHRKEIKSAMTPRAANMQLKKLAEYSPTVAVAMIEQTIANGWKGIFELKNNGSKPARGERKPQHETVHLAGSY